MAIVDRAKEKAGPLPVYGWVLVLSGLVVGILYWQKKKASKSAGQNDNIDPNTGQPYGIDPTTGQPMTMADEYGAADLQAEYSLANQLALVQSADANLATNVGAESTAVQANTGAVKQNSSATNVNTGATRANTGAINKDIKADKPVIHRKPPPKPVHKPPVRKRKPPVGRIR